MSLDRRLRADLERDAALIKMDVERSLDVVEGRALGGLSAGSWSPALLLSAIAIMIAISLHFAFTGPPTGGPSQVPSQQSSSPSATHSGPVCPIGRGSCRGPLQPGTYQTRSFAPAVTFTVPAGWENTLDQRWQVDLSYTRGGQYTYPDGTTFHDGISFFLGPVAESSTTVSAVPGVGRSARDLALWLSVHPDLIAADLAPVTVAGVSGYRVSLSLPSGPRIAPDHCTGDHGEPRCESLFVGDEFGGKYGFGLVGPETTVIYLLDTSPGVTVMVVIDDVDGVDATGLIDASTPIVESLVFAPPPAPTRSP